MGLLFKNNAETTLSSGINNSVTTVPVASAAVFPTPDANNVFFATIEEGNTIEVVKVTGISSNDLTVVRAQDNTSAAAFGAGAKIELRLTAKILEMGTSSLTDLDGDTKIEVEATADSDEIILTAPGVIKLDADGAEIQVKDGGTEIGAINMASSNLNIDAKVADKDIVFRGIDGSSDITALTLDMSDAGSARFTSNVLLETAGKYFQVAGSSSTFWAIGSTGGSNPPGTASTSLAFHHWDGSAWNNEVEFSSAGNITADGNLILGGTATFKFLNTTWINSADGVNRLYYTANSTSFYKTADDHVFRNASDANRFSIDNSGNGVFSGNVTAYGSPSDIKLKEDIEVIDNAVEKIKQLKGITYTLKSDGNRLTGLVAQDLEKVLPEAVYTEKDIETKDEHLAIRYGNTVGLLVEAIKELEARVKELEAK